MRAKRSFAVTSSFLAQMNSVASIASPIGMTTTAGPGSTIMATPTARIVNPITTMTRRLACPNVLNTKCLTFICTLSRTGLNDCGRRLLRHLLQNLFQLAQFLPIAGPVALALQVDSPLVDAHGFLGQLGG